MPISPNSTSAPGTWDARCGLVEGDLVISSSGSILRRRRLGLLNWLKLPLHSAAEEENAVGDHFRRPALDALAVGPRTRAEPSAHEHLPPGIEVLRTGGGRAAPRDDPVPVRALARVLALVPQDLVRCDGQEGIRSLRGGV